MSVLAWSLLGLSAVLLVAAGVRLAQMRAKYEQRGLLTRWPIRTVRLDQVDPVFATTPLGPSRDTEVAFVGAVGVPGGISDLETWVLCTLAKRRRAIFELGTCTGKTTYLLARNCPADGVVTTITLSPEQAAAYARAPGDAAHDGRAAVRESAFTTFYYTGTEVEPKVRQLFGDSKQFDPAPYERAFDLIFIDGSHARSYVENDSRLALRMAAPGAIILWHDYRGPRRAQGVFRALNALARELPLRHIAGTSLVFHRVPHGTGAGDPAHAR
ncbi:MAG: class I SAM-dependent methyltransferase [Planctomycetota bacterium]|nr:class I SAM-dependent methyltransferase [Planctomycetota bacterium]